MGKFLQDFKAFAMQSRIIDMPVGAVICEEIQRA